MVTKLSIGLLSICNNQIQLNIHCTVLQLFTSVIINCPFYFPSIAHVHVSLLVSHCTKTHTIQSVFLGTGFSFSAFALSKVQLLVWESEDFIYIVSFNLPTGVVGISPISECISDWMNWEDADRYGEGGFSSTWRI